MLKNTDLDKILDEGYGDAGFNDDVPELEEKTAPKAVAKGSAFRFPATKPAGASQAEGKEAAAAVASVAATPSSASAVSPAKEKEKEKSAVRPAILGAAPLPPEGTDLDEYELTQAMDIAARSQGFSTVEEYNAFLESQRKPDDEGMEEAQKQMEEMPLAPGIKKAPAYMPPGAYPGDRTKLGKSYDKELEEKEKEESKPAKPSKAAKPSAPETPAAAVAKAPPPTAAQPKSGMDSKYVKQSEKQNYQRANEGNTISYRLDGAEEEREVEIGGGGLPWALDVTARRMKIGDIMDVTGRGEHAFADEEEYQADAEKTWRFELVSIGGRSKDKFAISSDERIDLANEVRLKGNALFKKGRLLKAMDYYERGSSLMDVLEAEELGMPGAHKDKAAAEKNKRIWACQQPLLLNWALILMKLGRYKDAERKCTEVLMDIEKECVKALFRRGQCNIHLGKHEQARYDLRRAAELDLSITPEVKRELRKVEEMQREADRRDKGFSKKVVSELLKESDQRSEAPPPKEERVEEPTEKMMKILEAQRQTSDEQEVDEDDYCRQREAIYNQFLKMGPRQEAA